ncbi:MAG: type IV pilus biogenesis/stability protein PilW [Massilia sp.]|nr:type IV pilus biogenesis/stability protein PilW [Massilia sp.]
MAGLAHRGASGFVLCVLAATLAACAGSRTASADLPGSTQELKTASDETSTDKRASIRLQLAIGYYQEKNYEVALDEVKKALAADPLLADAYSVRALIYTAMDEMALADDNYLRAMRLAPRNPELSNNYGLFLCQIGRHAQGMAQFEVALKNPRYQSPGKAMVNAGGCALKMKDYATAERYLLDASRIDPDFPTIHAGLARVYYERRDMARAGFFINRLLAVTKMDSLSADVLWLATRIERKLGDKALESSLATQLRRRHPGSPEFAAFQRGAFDE